MFDDTMLGLNKIYVISQISRNIPRVLRLWYHVVYLGICPIFMLSK